MKMMRHLMSRTWSLLIAMILLAVSPGIAEELLSDEGSSSSSSMGKTTVLTVDVAESGDYYLKLDYKVTSTSIRKLVFSVRVNGESQQDNHEKVTLPSCWQDETQDYKQNAFGSDLYPSPVLVEAQQQQYLRERVYCADEPMTFSLNAGTNEIEITVAESDAEFYAVAAESAYAVPTLKAYLNNIPENAAQPAEDIVIEGEKYTYKGLSSTRAARSRDTNMHPFDASRATINYLAGATWDEPGESVTYRFTVEEAGVYYLALRYQQNEKSDMAVFKTIRMDGETPCAPLAAYGIDYTGSAVEETIISADGQAIPFYLTAGEHELTIVSTATPVEAAHKLLKQVITEMNNLALDIKVVSGNKTDTNREWNLEYYVPGVRENLEKIRDEIDQIYVLLENDNVGTGESTLSTLSAARRQIEDYLTEEDGMNDLVNQLSSFAQASGSMAESLSLLTADMLLQPLSIDRIYFLKDAQLPNDGMSLLESLWQEVRKTALSFVMESDTGLTNSEDKLNVWLIGSAQELEILREMVDQAFPADTVHVALANESKIQLAIAAGNAPDVVLGGGITQPYQLGIRNAVYDLSQFDDFEEVSSWFYSEAFVPVSENGKVYALPQTMDMWVMFYRSDILDNLGLEVPETWDDMIAMLPTLYRYGMSVNTALSSGGALKSFTQMMPVIMQYGGSLYTEDGMSAAFTTSEFIEGFTMLTNLYTKYSLDTSISNFYSSFRNGNAPIGVSALTTYTLLRQAASELDGMWGIALMPATETEDGLQRQHPSVVSGCYILSATERADEGWNFLKWWMSDDTQSNFSVRLQTTYGEEYLWLTANKKALSECTLLAHEDLLIILEQLESLEEVPSHPASMLVQRALSDAWNRVVLNGEDPRQSLDTAQLEANRGIQRKLQQFGLIDDQGEQIDTLWQEEEQ